MRIVLSLPLLMLASSAPTASAGDLLQLVVMGSGGESDAALDQVARNSNKFLNEFVQAEGSSYKLVQRGGSLPVARKLEEASEPEEQRRQLPDTGCPNSCSNSGSTKCRILGCAFCGPCDRRRHRSLQQVRTAAQQRKIESDLQADLDQYCEGKTGCTLHARILRTKSDGTVSRAN